MRSAIRTVEKRCEISSAILPVRQFRESLEHLVLGARVERRRRLVENQQLRVAQVRAGQRHLLPLAAREVHAAFEAPSEQLIVALPAAAGSPASARLLRAASSTSPLSAPHRSGPTAMFWRAVIS